ncbi:MAG: helix-turn-helix transcriptional regulator [Chitinophagaceae bacterium]|nr:helix-turn-helix transcriptional regulator [Chitinophagaceae bacterium]
MQRIVELWQNHFLNNPHNHEEGSSPLQTDILSKMPQSNLLTVVFSFTDLSILHINDAAAAFFGATTEEIKQEGASSIIACFDEEQLKFAMHAAEISARDVALGKVKNVLETYTCYVNWIINNRKGKRNRALFRIFPIELNENGLPLTGMYLIYDIMPFLKDGLWWYRSFLGRGKCLQYHSEEKKWIAKDLLSEREKMILSLIAEGYSSKELGDKLNISSHTIYNHRRRMLAKTGAVDTSALIHVAKLSGILN